MTRVELNFKKMIAPNGEPAVVLMWSEDQGIVLGKAGIACLLESAQYALNWLNSSDAVDTVNTDDKIVCSMYNESHEEIKAMLDVTESC